MPRRVNISACAECPFSCHKKGDKRPYCLSMESFINVDPNYEIDPRCSLEETSIGENNKEDHRIAIKNIYQILQKKGMNEDSMHEANTYFNQYLKDLKN